MHHNPAAILALQLEQFTRVLMPFHALGKPLLFPTDTFRYQPIGDCRAYHICEMHSGLEVLDNRITILAILSVAKYEPVVRIIYGEPFD